MKLMKGWGEDQAESLEEVRCLLVLLEAVFPYEKPLGTLEELSSLGLKNAWTFGNADLRRRSARPVCKMGDITYVIITPC